MKFNNISQMVNLNTKIAPLAIAIATAISIPLSVEAAEVETEKNAGKVERIVVTATRRSESIQSVPMNISAMGGDDMESRAIADFDGISKSIPGLTLNDSSPRAGLTNSWVIRGLDNTGVGAGAKPASQQAPVATYVNETPVFVNLRLKDLERVEVLRGPQGTLYGAGSLGGAIRFITKKPEDFLSAKITAGINQYADSDDIGYETDIILNVPLTDEFSARVHLGTEKIGGWIDNVDAYQLDTNGDPVLANPNDIINSLALLSPEKKDVNDVGTDSYRISLRWQPSDELDMNFSYHHQEQNSGGRNAIAYSKYGTDSRKSNFLTSEEFDSEVDLASLEIEANLGFATLSSSTSYYNTKAKGQTDYSNLYLDLGIYESIYGASPRPYHTQQGQNNNKGFTQELRLVSNTDGAIDWVAGIYYSDQDIELKNEQQYKGYQEYFDACAPVHGIWFTTGETLCGLGTIVGERNGIDVTDETTYQSNIFTSYQDLALFGEVTWHITDTFEITGGARSFKQEYESNQQAGLLWAPDAPGNVTLKGEADDTLFKFNSAWNFAEDTMMYVTLSEGFRRGGVNGLPETVAGTPTNPELFSYEPDKVFNKEIGIKGTLGDNYQYTFTVFQVDWNDMQIDASATPLVLQAVENVGKVTNQGIETDFSGNITDNIFLSAGYSYVDSEIINLDVAPDGVNGLPEVGESLPGVPSHTANVMLRYYQEFENDWNAEYSLSGSYRSSVKSIDKAGFDPHRDGEAQQTWDFVATLNLSEKLSITGYVKNIFDDQSNLAFIRSDFVQSNSKGLFGIPSSEPSDRLTPFNDRAWSKVTAPRMIGIRINYLFEE